MQNVASKNADFTNHAMSNSDPFRVCTDSETFRNYRLTMNFYNELLTSHEPANKSLCSDEYLNKNRMNVITQMITNSKNVWESANCDSCYNDTTSMSQVFSDDTKTFNSSYYNYLDCTKHPPNGSSICTDCEGSYQTLNSIFEHIKKSSNNKVCFDLDDQVRRILTTKKIMCFKQIFSAFFR